jgi:PAS domain S-box-containing protein
MSTNYAILSDEKKAKILIQFLGVSTWVIAVFSVLDYFIYAPETTYVLSSMVVMMLVLRFLFKNQKISYTFCTSILSIFTVFIIVPFASYFSGGLFSPIMPWLVIIPVGGILLLGIGKEVFFFTGIGIFILIVFAILELNNHHLPTYQTDRHFIGYFASIIGLILLGFFLTWLFEKQKNQALQSLQEEKELFVKHASQLPGTIYQLQIFADGRSQYNFVSDGARNMFGFTPNRFIENPNMFFSMVHPEDLPLMKAGLQQSKKTLQRWIYEGRILLPENRLIYVKGNANPEKQADGSIIFFGYVYDATDEKRAEQALQESQLNFKQITDTINDVFYLYDIANKKYLFISPNCKEVLGIADQFFYDGSSFTKHHVHEEDKALLRAANERVDSGEAYEIAFRVYIDGDIRWIQEKSFPIKDAIGNIVKNSGILTDVTEQKVAQEKFLESQSYVKQITSTINDVFFLYDTIKKKYLFVSPNCQTVLGVLDSYFYEGNDYTGAYVYEADRQKLIEAYQQLGTNMEYNLDYRVVLDGQIKWINEKSFAIKDEDGQFVKMSGIVTDITARQSAAERLRKSQQGLEEAQELAHIGNWEFDFFDSTNIWSKEMYRILEIEEDVPTAALFATFQQKVHADDVRTVKQAIQFIIETRTVHSVECRVLCKDSVTKHVSVIAEPILSEKNKKLIGLKGTVQDITKQRLASMAKSNFLSTMSHEIRTPINGVIGISNLLMSEELSPVQKEYVNTLNFSAQHLSTIVSDILDFSKIESGSFTFEKVSFNVEQVCNNIFKLFEAQAAEKNISFTFKPQAIEGFSLYGDYVRLSQVLTNLISNAVKFTHEGGVELSYSILRENEHNISIQFAVKDSGIGITSDQQNRIFESFLQADDSVTRKYGGTGLGLTICKKLVELQGGKIYVESQQDKGSTFFVELTFDKHSFTNEVISKMPVTELDRLSLKGMKILVAEDNKINAMVLTRFLTKWDIESKVAVDGQLAVDMANAENFDMILMDLQMPVMDGRSATNHIRASKDAKLANLPIVALTADALIESQRALLKCGFNDCITKPFSPEVLFKVLKKYYS